MQKNLSIICHTINKYKYIYILLLPTLAFYLLFSYYPMYGIILAFKEYQFNKPIISAPWVGFDNFIQLFQNVTFVKAFVNTIIISTGRLIFEFPVPILIAFLLNEIRKTWFKKIIQTAFTFPHFLSWIIVIGIINSMLSSEGVVNQIISVFGMEKQNLLIQPSSFRALLYITDLWKEMGWSTIIYFAALSSIDPEQYEAAVCDGANRLQQAIHVTWPGIFNTVMVMLLLNIGNLLNNGNFDQIINIYNPAVYDVSDIIDTYIYRSTFIQGANFSVSTAVGLFKSIINFLLLISVNNIVKLAGRDGIF